MKSNRGSRISKKIGGKPIIVDDRTMIPMIEYAAFTIEICIGKNVGEMIMANLTVTPTEFKVIQGNEEWMIKIPETHSNDLNI